MKEKLLVLIIMVFCFADVFAIYDFELIDYNNIAGYISNCGIIGQNMDGNSGVYWPKSYPLQTYVYGSGLWFGGLVDTAFTVIGNDTTFYYDTLVSCGYDANSGNSEFVPGDGTDNPAPYNMEEFKIYLSNEHDYPVDSVLSQLDSYCSFNDMDENAHFSAENKPLEILVEQFTYEFVTFPLVDVMLIHLKIINKSDKRIRNAYIGYNTDNDIGSASNELLGFIENEDIGYQFQLEDELGWSNEPGLIGWTYIQGPLATDTVDVKHDGSVIVLPGDTLGMTAFNTIIYSLDPSTKQQRYQFMAGYNHLTFNPADPEASFQPFPEWGVGVVGYPGETEDSSLAGDKRFIISSGPFNMEANDTVELVVAFAIKDSANEMIYALTAAKNWWKNRMTQNLTLLNPSEFHRVSSSTNFTWSASKSLPYFDINFSDCRNDNSQTYRGDNIFSYMLDPVGLEDGLYKWSVANYNMIDLLISKESKFVIIDNSGINGIPCIAEFKSEYNGGLLYFDWLIVDPDDNLTYQKLELINQYGNSVFSQFFTKSDTQLIINAYNSLPNGYYTAYLTALDDSGAIDSSYVEISNWFNHPGEYAYAVSGDNNTVMVSYLTYDKTLCTFHKYEVHFKNPYIGELGVYIPFSIIDSNLNTTVLEDTAIFESNFEYFYSKVFDGLGIALYYYNSLNQTCDSLKIINDAGYDYPDSLLYVSQSLEPIFLGRNIEIRWHEDSDSLYADFVVSGYTDNIPYGTTRNYNYYFGTTVYNSDYIFDSTITYTQMYVPGTLIYFNRPGKVYPMDTLWAPEEGEVWKLFTSGDRLPIKGDVYKFRPTGVGAYSEAKKMNKLSLMCDLKGSQLTYTITGSAEDIELKLYDIQGRNVKTIFKGRVIGRRDSRIYLEIPSGIYFLKEKDGKFETKKLLMIK